MSALPAEQLRNVLLEDILKLASERPDGLFEVVDGEIVEKIGAGALHHIIITLIFRILDTFVVQHDLGIVIPDGVLYILDHEQPGIKGGRIPDAAFVRKQNMPAGWNIEQPFPIAPDLAIEVMSPNDLIEETLVRVREYLAAGTQKVWVVFPRLKEVHVYAGDAVQIYQHDAVMDVAALFPGLTVRVSEFFAIPAWMQPKSE